MASWSKPSLERYNDQITGEERGFYFCWEDLVIYVERYLAWKVVLEGEPCDENLCCERTLHATGLYSSCYRVTFAPSESFQSSNACL